MSTEALTRKKRAVGARVLVAFEDAYRLYQETIAGGLVAMRPDVEVVSAELNELDIRARTFQPHVIICSLPRIVNPISVLAWVQLSPYPQQRSRIWIDERYWEALNPAIEEILSVVDEAEKLLREQVL